MLKQQSKPNRSYQQALIAIKQSIEKPSKETLAAIQKAEDLAFEVEKMIGVEYRKPKSTPIQQCSHKLTCVHFTTK